jgi:hypothetical protein
VTFFGPAGEELEREETNSWHVLTTVKDVLTRDQLNASVAKGGYACQVLDPSDLRPLANGPLGEECLLVARTKEALDGLPRRRTRDQLLATRDIVLIDLVVESPFNATQVFGPLEGLEGTFGADGVRILRNAKTLYAVNVPPQSSPLAIPVLEDLSRIVAKEVKGSIYDADSGRFISLT